MIRGEEHLRNVCVFVVVVVVVFLTPFDIAFRVDFILFPLSISRNLIFSVSLG